MYVISKALVASGSCGCVAVDASPSVASVCLQDQLTAPQKVQVFYLSSFNVLFIYLVL